MDENTARVIMASIIGGTICISMVAMALANIITSRRRKDPPDVTKLDERLERMELAIDAMAMEVERVAENQRFTSKLLADRQVERQT